MGHATVAKWIKDMLPKKCCNCGSTENLQYHHIVPVVYGGNEVPTNVAVLCGSCHSKTHYGKGDVINHNDAVRRGLEAAKARGVKLGRKEADAERIIKAIAENSSQFHDICEVDWEIMTEDEIMSMLGVKSVCYYKYKKELVKAISADTWPYDWPKPKVNHGHPVYANKLRRMRGDSV